MELHQFEQAILKLAFETQSRITTASVAYYLGVPSRDANRMLNALLAEGALELDSDENGNLFYRVPHQTDDGEKLKELREAHAYVADEPRPNFQMNATLDDDSTAEPFSPIHREVDAQSLGPIDHSPVDRPHAMIPRPPAREKRDRWGGFDDYYGDTPVSGPDGAAGRRVVAQKVLPTWSAVSSRASTTDGTVGTSSGSRYLVASNARCEPQPLPSNRPIMAACDDATTLRRESSATATRENRWYSESNSTAMVASQNTALSTEIEQPEHQPGMALLLSLILPGTGQMYNGEISKGVMMMVLSFLLWFVLLGWVVHIWSIVDAVVVAEKVNRKQV